MEKMAYALAVLAAAATFGSSAHAQMGGGRRACKDDVQKFCSDVQPGGGRIIHCLQDHSDQLSDQCHEAMGKLEERRGERGGPDQGGNDNGGTPLKGDRGDNVFPIAPHDGGPPPEGGEANDGPPENSGRPGN